MKHTCCGKELHLESSGDRDTETMGGLEVEYLRCSLCGKGYELILDPLDGDRLYRNDSPPETNFVTSRKWS